MLYYFLTTAFPALHLHSACEMSFQELHVLLEENLSEKDFAVYRCFLLYIDLKNVKALLAKKPIDPRGFLSKQELTEAILQKQGLPDYLLCFLDNLEKQSVTLDQYTSVYAEFFREKRSGFLEKYFTFQRSMRLTLLALRAKKWGKDLLYEMQFEQMQDPFVAYIIAQKDAVDFLPTPEFAELKKLFKQYEDSPLSLEKHLVAYQLEKIEEFEEPTFFTVEQVLAFSVKLFLVESWHLLDRKEGKKRLSEIV